MRFHHLRSATALLTLGEHRLLVDPMLGDVGAMPPFRLFGEGRRNPLVPLPAQAEGALARATAALVTHEHADHLDRAGIALLRERRLPVWTSAVDAPNLARKGLAAQPLLDGSLGMRVELVRSRHARGLFGWVLGPVCGYYLALPGEPSVYLIGDSIGDARVTEAIARLQPDVIVAPAGSASVGLGGRILFSIDELVALAHVAQGQVIFNHLEALDHCPTTRHELRARLRAEGLEGRTHVPEDGEEIRIDAPAGRAPRAPAVLPHLERPGVQKWLSALWLTGT